VRLGGRVTRYVAILRGVAHQISNKPDRTDRPPDAAQAKARLEAHLQALRDQTSRVGLSGATAKFLDHIQATTQRYGPNLFTCFDDPRIPATTNLIEGFNGHGKRIIRKAVGTKSTANSLVHNLDVEFLLALNQVHRSQAGQPRRPRPKGRKPVPVASPAAPNSVQQPPGQATRLPPDEAMPAMPRPYQPLVPSADMDIDIRKYKEVRSKLKKGEEPAQQNRSFVRKLETHLLRVSNMLREVMGL
jgi:hypothetical protein